MPSNSNPGEALTVLPLKPPRLKMYILILESVPLEKAINSNAHASLACYLKFRDDPVMKEWLAISFAKVTCKVNAAEFAKAKECEDICVITESSLGGQEVAVAFKPRYEWPNVVKYAKLYKVEPEPDSKPAGT